MARSEVELHPCTAISRAAGHAEWSKSVGDMASGGDGGTAMVRWEEFQPNARRFFGWKDR